MLQVTLAARADNLVRWASLSFVGVLPIVGSSYLERHKDALARYFTVRKEEDRAVPGE